MSNNTIIPLRQPDLIDDPLIDALQSRARELLAKAVKVVAQKFLAAQASMRTAHGLMRIVRHGHGPGIGSVTVRRPKVHERGGDETAEDRNRFRLAFLPKMDSR